MEIIGNLSKKRVKNKQINNLKLEVHPCMEQTNQQLKIRGSSMHGTNKSTT
jgi:hypothetical protein